MRVTLCVVGRLRAGPERDLVDDYLDRFGKTGRSLGLGPATVREVDDRKNTGPSGEAPLLRKAIPSGAFVCALDERGSVLSSPKFAKKISGWRDSGTRDLAFLIGGADGLAPELRSQADASLSFGEMVWPHMLVRVMLAEQLYRAAAILAGTPYHRV